MGQLCCVIFSHACFCCLIKRNFMHEVTHSKGRKTLFSNLNWELSIQSLQLTLARSQNDDAKEIFFGCFNYSCTFFLSYVKRFWERCSRRESHTERFMLLKLAPWRSKCKFYATGKCDCLMPPLHTLSCASRSFFFSKNKKENLKNDKFTELTSEEKLEQDVIGHQMFAVTYFFVCLRLITQLNWWELTIIIVR